MKKSRIIRRKGAVAALVAILLVALLAMVAFCLDYGYMIRVNAELQNAADAAALAGASQLMGPQIGGATVSSEQANASIAAARTAARQFSQLNTAGSVALNMLSSDTVVGYMANPR